MGGQCKTFVKLMEALMESALMYATEVWGRCKWLDCIDLRSSAVSL